MTGSLLPPSILLAGRVGFLKHTDRAAAFLKTLRCLSFSIGMKFNPTTKFGIIRLMSPMRLPLNPPEGFAPTSQTSCIHQTWQQAPPPACAHTTPPAGILTSFSANHPQSPVQMSPPLGSPPGCPLARQAQFPVHSPIIALLQAQTLACISYFPGYGVSSLGASTSRKERECRGEEDGFWNQTPWGQIPALSIRSPIAG